MSHPAAGSQIDRIKEFYRRSDAGEFAAELFAPDFQFYWPKFGVGRGQAAFFELARNLRGQLVARISHHLDELLFIEAGNRVVVEGTTQGVGQDGVEWHGTRTPGGRFCSVFAFNSLGLIERMHVYLDPDLTGRDQAGFIWKERLSQQW